MTTCLASTQGKMSASGVKSKFCREMAAGKTLVVKVAILVTPADFW